MNGNLLLITDRSDLTQLHAQVLINSGIVVSVVNQIPVKNKMSTQDLHDYDLILLNMFEDESNSIEICRKLRAEYHNPILALVYARDERFQLRLYDAGVDDCLVQPLGINLLLIKVQTWLRRSDNNNKPIDVLHAFDFHFDPVKNEVTTPKDILVRLSLLEARLLRLLMGNSGCIVETSHIIQRVWSDNGAREGDRHLLKALVHRLRQKIEVDPTHPQYIHSIMHQGYSFRLFEEEQKSNAA